MKYMTAILALASILVSCYPEKAAVPRRIFEAPPSLPPLLAENIHARAPEFFAELDSLVSKDTLGLLVLVDKTHPLSADYAPSDLVSLGKNRPYAISRDGLSLRESAERSLAEMAEAARRAGVTLLVSSSYRSYAYQKTVYARNVAEMGSEEADRVSAKPGTSQHQLGTAADFGSITDEFAKTAAGKWLYQHAGEYGWSLSFPDGYEEVTGYRWESWHYRYIGIEGAAFQKKWFGGVQQFMMEAIAGL